ncbi:MAG: hypothetical protein ACC650_02860 [Gammaproteobacteria bacterium]
MSVDSPPPNNRIDPVILQQDINGAQARFDLQVPDDLIYFENHFPGVPMLPGVVQTKWVVELANQLLLAESFFDNFSAMTKLKFMRPITPGNRLSLQLTASSSDKSLSFRFFDDQGDYSSGQLSFK